MLSWMTINESPIMIARKPAPTFVEVCREIAHERINEMTSPEEILGCVGFDLEGLLDAIRDGRFNPTRPRGSSGTE
jgi:hypothetical protein